MVQDLRFALRQLRRTPGFTATAVLTLGLGVGATTAMYNVVSRVLLQPLPYPEQDQLVGLDWSTAGQNPQTEQTGETADFLLAHAKSFSSMGVADDGTQGANLSTGNGKPMTIRSLRASEGYLRTLGVAPMLGRGFTAEEDHAGGAAVAVVSYGLWKNELNSDQNAVGRVIRVNGEPYTIVGVMPKTFAEVDGPDLWTPLRLGPSDPGYFGDNFQMVGRLKTGVSLEQARAELLTLTNGIYAQNPGYKNWYGPGRALLGERVWPLHNVVVSSARTSLMSLMGAVTMVLLVACLNVAGLMTVRAIRRRREIAVRMALGAKRTAVIRLLMAESVVLAVGGALAGVACAMGLGRLMRTVAPITAEQLNPGAGATHIWWMLGIALAIGLATTLIFGLLPAVGLLRRSVTEALSGSNTAGETVSHQRTGRLLMVGQVALATMLLSASTLFLGTFLKMRSIPPGVTTKMLDVLQVNLKGDSFAHAENTLQFIDRVEERVRRIPSVSQVATVNGLPLDRGLNSTAWPERLGKDAGRNVEQRFVTPGYFHTVGIPLLGGRDISTGDREDSERVALVNQRMAQLWWPDRSPIGEYVSQGKQKWRIIGVAGDVHNRSLASEIRPTWYVPYRQVDDKAMGTINGWFPTSFVIRVAGDASIAAEVERAMHEVNAEVPVGKFAEMQSFIDSAVAAPRYFAWMSGGFALFSLAFTGVGLFGLLSYQVAARTKEIGVRMAVGAAREQILLLVMRRGMALTLIGLALGAAGSVGLRRVIEHMLTDTVHGGVGSINRTMLSSTVALTAAVAVMLLAAMLASALPARRAASIEPTEALRTE
jgi:predicted permease